MRCETCNSEAPDPSATACPFCRSPLRADRLGRANDNALTRVVDDRLARAAVESMLTRTEALGELLRDDLLAGPLSAAELRNAAHKAAGDGDALARENLDELDRLVPAELVKMDLDGLKLAGLVDKKAGDLAVLKTGFVLLRARRYDEAAEYWSLKRESLAPGHERLELLLLLMEMFTHVLAGRTGDAARVRTLVREHPMFDRYRGDRAGTR